MWRMESIRSCIPDVEPSYARDPFENRSVLHLADKRTQHPRLLARNQFRYLPGIDVRIAPHAINLAIADLFHNADRWDLKITLS